MASSREKTKATRVVSRGSLRKPGNFIAGRFSVPSRPDGVLETRSPADTEDVVGVHPFSRSSVLRAVSAARAAAKPWRKLGEKRRRALLLRYQRRIEKNEDALAETIAREVGKPLWEARSEVRAMIAKVDLSLGPGSAWTQPEAVETLPGEIRFRPHGVLSVVGPFNFPGHLPNGQIVPALLLGNTVVFKPSDKTPSVGTWIACCFAEAGFPPGVFNLVQGDASVAETLVNHPDINGVLFTGSQAVGRKIAAANAERFDRLIALELGGKNASIVLDDCDVDAAVREIAFAGFATAGQRCTATSRVLVTRKIADAFARRLAEAAQRIVVGYPFDEGVFMGPLITEEARSQLLDAQSAALAAGFEPLSSGRPVQVVGRPGWYMRPAVHLSPSRATHVPEYEDRELFGPDIAVYVVDDLDEAVELANRSEFGLAASVFTASRKKFDEVAEELEVGIVHWNRSSAGASGRLPFGGIKRSGNHRPGGILMGAACAYPQALLLEEPNAQTKPKFPGFDV